MRSVQSGGMDALDRQALAQELMELSAAFGPSGFERPVADLFHRALAGAGTPLRDRLGSVAVELPGEGPRIMLAAHLDEVGFMVKSITPEGHLRFVPLGSWWSQVVLSGAVRIAGRRGEVRGVIGSKPPHFLKEKEKNEPVPFDAMFIDVAAGSREEAEAMGLGPGDPAVPEVAPFLLRDGACLMGKALDDRVGVLAVIEAARRLRGSSHPNTVLAAGTVQEEVGARGARTAASLLRPEICLVVEGTPADDSPGFARDASQGVLGRGPQIRLFDPSMIGHRPLIDLVREVAAETGLPYQVAVREGGGTDGGPIHVADIGVPSMVIGIPVRYAHSQIGLCSLADLENAVELLAAVVRRLDAVTVAGLTF